MKSGWRFGRTVSLCFAVAAPDPHTRPPCGLGVSVGVPFKRFHCSGVTFERSPLPLRATKISCALRSIGRSHSGFRRSDRAAEQLDYFQSSPHRPLARLCLTRFPLKHHGTTAQLPPFRRTTDWRRLQRPSKRHLYHGKAEMLHSLRLGFGPEPKLAWKSQAVRGLPEVIAAHIQRCQRWHDQVTP